MLQMEETQRLLASSDAAAIAQIEAMRAEIRERDSANKI
jgi:hypothetical protein